MKRNKYIIIGLGGTGQELLKKISKDIDAVCIDLNPEAGEEVKKICEECRFIAGDATSRLVLESAEVNDADAVIITTGLEKVNIETARILKEHFDPKRVIAISTTKAGMEELEGLGAEVERIVNASAVAIRNRLTQASRAAHAIGLGKDEILEVEVHPNSRLANRSLRSLTPVSWKIGLIYRDEHIVVPNRDAVLKPGDRVVILGDPTVLKTVSEILTFKFERFPLEYGSTAVAYLTGGEEDIFFRELDYLLSVLSIDRITFIFSRKASQKSELFHQFIKKDNLRNSRVVESTLPADEAIRQTIRELKGDHGLIAMPKKIVRSFFLNPRNRRFLYSLISSAECPLLLCNGTFPYEKAVVPCIEQVNLQHTLETSLEISLSVNNEITALLVKPSQYISTSEDMKLFESMKGTVNDVSSMYRMSIDKKQLDGNPIKSISEAMADYNLLIADTGRWRKRFGFIPFLSPDVLWHIIRRSGISTLLLPPTEKLY